MSGHRSDVYERSLTPRLAGNADHPRRPLATRSLGALLIAAMAGACASFTPAPRAPTPRGEGTPTPAGVQRVRLPPMDELVPYRPLNREDFRATAPPRGRGAATAHVAASTCAYLIFDPGLRFRAVRRRGQDSFTAEVTDLRFEARMDPSCSWWDKANRFRPDDYVLEHEQIHFDIVEAEARRLNREAGSLSQSLESSGATSEEALASIQAKFQAAFDSAVQRVAEQSRRFDEETSLGFRPEAQSDWAQRMQRELSELEGLDTDSVE